MAQMTPQESISHLERSNRKLKDSLDVKKDRVGELAGKVDSLAQALEVERRARRLAEDKLAMFGTIHAMMGATLAMGEGS